MSLTQNPFAEDPEYLSTRNRTSGAQALSGIVQERPVVSPRAWIGKDHIKVVSKPILSSNSVTFIDLLRALAASFVLLDHASSLFGSNHVASGAFGVSVFFILSGFLICQSSLVRLQRPGSHFSPYLIDRFSRIFTAYIPALVLVALVNAAVDLHYKGQDGTSTGLTALLGNMLLLQNYPFFQAAHRLVGDAWYIRPYNTAEPFWTIPIEFSIYIVFGLGFFQLIRQERVSWLVGTGLGLAALPVVIWNAAAGGGNGLSLVWLFGAVTAYFWVTTAQHSARKLHLGCIFGALALACLVGRGLKTDWNLQDLGMAACEAVIFLSGIAIMDGIPALPHLVRRTCTVLASYSYSLYLVHNTVFIVVRQTLGGILGAATLPVALAAAHLVAIAMYLLFERHYRHVGKVLKRMLLGQRAGKRDAAFAASMTPTS